MRVIEIVRAHLVSNGFDGLVHSDSECGCELSCLQPCGEDFADCKPGYKHLTPGGEYDWVISESKEPPNA